MTVAAATVSQPKSQSNRVSALCQDETLLTFTCERYTTLGQLAERLGMLAIPHGGLSLPVQVRLAAGQKKRARGCRRPTRQRSFLGAVGRPPREFGDA
jgi:hypothetical protein